MFAQSIKAAKAPVFAQVRRAHLLKEKLRSLIPGMREEYTSFVKANGEKIVDHVSISQIVGGSRSIKSMLWETSLLDANEGIRFRGLTIPELQKALPPVKAGGEPTPEGTLWFLMTGQVPTKEETDFLTADLHKRSALPDHVKNVINAFPKTMHPMAQFVAAIATCASESQFDVEYKTRSKKDLWEPAFEDCLNLIAKLPVIAAMIYNNCFGNGVTGASDPTLDYAANFNRLINFPATGKPDEKGPEADGFDEYMRLYFSIHSDHEGGNASAHANRLISSTLASPMVSFAGSMAALSGPLHGLANEECLQWQKGFFKDIEALGGVSKEAVEKLAWDTLNSGKVIPGFGHAVLRKTDPRYTCQREFALKHLPHDPLFQLVSTIYEVVPGVLTKHGKTKNPYPNIDSHSGCILYHYGLKDTSFYTVLFGIGRALGVLSQLVLDRAVFFHPLERPKSVDMKTLKALAEKADN